MMGSIPCTLHIDITHKIILLCALAFYIHRVYERMSIMLLYNCSVSKAEYFSQKRMPQEWNCYDKNGTAMITSSGNLVENTLILGLQTFHFWQFENLLFSLYLDVITISVIMLVLLNIRLHKIL